MRRIHRQAVEAGKARGKDFVKTEAAPVDAVRYGHQGTQPHHRGQFNHRKRNQSTYSSYNNHSQQSSGNQPTYSSHNNQSQQSSTHTNTQLRQPFNSQHNVTIKLSEIPDVESDEDWNIPQTVGSVNANIQASLKERNVTIPRRGATKSERKAHYMEERKRHNGFEDVKQPSTSFASASSVDNDQPLRKP